MHIRQTAISFSVLKQKQILYPGFEILANEVKCSHGATTSRIDPQELFYLRSRGIPTVEAEKLIALGFLSESLDLIEHQQTREWALNCLADSFAA